jgi:hypothetical protein
MPPNPSDKQSFHLTTSQTITSLTVSAASGQTMIGAPTTITSTTPIDFVYNAATASWFRN